MLNVNDVGGFPGQPQRRYDPHSNFYNPGWRDHPNFSYKNQGEQSKPHPQTFNQPPLAQAPSQAPNSSMRLEDIVKSLALATSFSQLATQSSGKLPSQTEANPRENVSATTLQSGKELQPVEPTSTKAKERGKSLDNTESHTDKVDSNFVPPTLSNTCTLPFPYRMSKSKEDEHEREILDIFKKVEINIPLLDAIKQIPKYAKFLKELCTNKRKLNDKERIIFSKNVSTIINRKLPEKCKDPGMFTLPCIIGNKRIERAMLDLGASINVMPYSVYQALNLSTLQDTNVIIQLADRSYVRPMGLVEDVLVKVNDLLFPVDFYILKMGTEGLNNSASVLLDRPFMKTAKTKIDVDEVVHDVVEEELVGTELDLIMEMDESDGEDDFVESLSEAPKLELKPLPEHLKYIYLGSDETLPAIISSKLSKEHEERLVTLLREHRTAIGWTLADIKGISLAMCMHRIYLEDNTKSSREPQRRLNPTLKEVVMKEILKLHDACIIFSISDSAWVSPVYVVPKKPGYYQIFIAQEDQEKTTFTCPFGTFAFRRMPFGLCNTPDQGIVLGHVVSSRGIEVDKAKVDLIVNLTYPTSVSEIRSFIRHARFYRRFIKDFAKIAQPLSRLLQNEVNFVFGGDCQEAFDKLKRALTSAPIIQPPDWSIPFEIMCDARNYAVGAVLGQRIEKTNHVIYYASKTLDAAQCNYSTTEKELLAIVFTLDKFRSYLLGSKIVVFSDHAALKHLLSKKEFKPRLIRWILLLQEFDLTIKDRKGSENLVADHLSRLIREEDDTPICDSFPGERLFNMQGMVPWYYVIVNYLVARVLPPNLSRAQIDKVKSEAKYYVWDDPYLWRFCADQVVRRCVPNDEHNSVLSFCHNFACGSHFGPKRTARKVLECGLYWNTFFKDAYEFYKKYNKCQRMGTLSHRNEMPQTPILIVEIFDVWGIDFMGPFPSSCRFSYILLAVDYVSKWVEAKATQTDDSAAVIDFVKFHIFNRFGVPRAIISDQGSHFCNRAVLYSRVMASTIAWQQPITLRQMAKLRCQIER
ncbi:UNVERIFIED_CONTAM: Retrovirus-related Pol polyprotein from transposon.6 [Sesamum latifolium]|uniref:RNA-directed DNA polymerase n=1 Tax=Sesamum latifolium TaxID=2727402 RepID=A0AAW2X7A8_9LAMI